jgi:hypothetical protein
MITATFHGFRTHKTGNPDAKLTQTHETLPADPSSGGDERSG